MSFPTLGSPSAYDGDSPFWTLLFTDPVPRGARDEALRACFDIDRIPGAASVDWSWSADDRVEVGLGDCWFPSSKTWKKAREAVSEAIDAVHGLEPLTAVVFLDADGMAKAPKEVVSLYASLKKARGKKRRALALEALASEDATLEDLALSFVGAYADAPGLVAFAERSEVHAGRARDALSEVLRQHMFDYGKKPERFEAVLSAAPDLLLDSQAFGRTVMAAVRDLPRMGSFLKDFAAERPEIWAAMREDWAQRRGDVHVLTLAFALAELGEVEAAREYLGLAREALREKEAKTALWKVQIPAWVEELEQRLA